MQLISGAKTLGKRYTGTVLTIGNFDGVHIGHQVLIERVVHEARRRSRPSVVATFEPHPVKFLYPERQLHRIFSFEDQRQQLERLGVDVLLVEAFSREFSELAPEAYLEDWILKPFAPQMIVVGHDFSFGRDRQGSISFLQTESARRGFSLEVVPPVKIADVVVSSTRIRQAVELGDVSFAKKMLARPFYLSGLVERGEGRGRKIGIPTANIHVASELLPARGVYAGWAHVRGQRVAAVTNIGLNPTFSQGRSLTNTQVNNHSLQQKFKTECHLIDFSGDLYGAELRFEFLAKLRDERKFENVEALVAQIKTDIADCKRQLV